MRDKQSRVSAWADKPHGTSTQIQNTTSNSQLRPRSVPQTGQNSARSRFSLSSRYKMDSSDKKKFESSADGSKSPPPLGGADSDRVDIDRIETTNTASGKQQKIQQFFTPLANQAAVSKTSTEPAATPVFRFGLPGFKPPSFTPPPNLFASKSVGSTTAQDQCRPASSESSALPSELLFSIFSPVGVSTPGKIQKTSTPGLPGTDQRRLEKIQKTRTTSGNHSTLPSKPLTFGGNGEIKSEIPPVEHIPVSTTQQSPAGTSSMPGIMETTPTLEAASIFSSSTSGNTKPAVVSKSPAEGKVINQPMPVNGTSVTTPSESSVEDQDTERDNGNSPSCTSESDVELEAEEAIRKQHLRLLDKRADTDELNEVVSTPLFTEPVRKYAHALAKTSFATPFSQYGLLGGDISGNDDNVAPDRGSDPRVYWNIAAPSSFFICGSQGSGKSHHLSCLLENALAPCAANILPRPLTGILFHYDTFVSDAGGSPCEAAWLSTNPKIKVRVLCPPTNIGTMRKLYGRFPNIHVQELRLNESNLDTKRMLNLMAVSANGNMPLYMSVVNRILRDLRITQQQSGLGFDYSAFKQALSQEPLTEAQMAPLKQRLDTLESFMVEGHAKAFDLWAGRTGGFGARPEPQGQAKKPAAPVQRQAKRTAGSTTGIDWSPQHGRLTIVDLSCPCVTAEMACSLFNICLSLFLEQDSTSVGRVVALDEAHKYMNESAECQMLTQALLETIRLQRHLGARVLISTQEPTISPKLLDLCSVTAVHRFTSPDWLNVLRKHIAGVSKGAEILERTTRLAQRDALAKGGATEDDELKEIIDGVGTLNVQDAGGDPLMELFSKIVSLKVGEALIFAPSAIIGVRKKVTKTKTFNVVEETMGVQRLVHGVLKVRIRNRTTADGGKSIMAA